MKWFIKQQNFVNNFRKLVSPKLVMTEYKLGILKEFGNK